MPWPGVTEPDLRSLIETDRVHSSLYTNPQIFEAELERIWYRTWVFVGHASEIAEPGDYVVKSIGPQPVIMTRDREGQVHLLLNRCAHRGNLVCDAPHGNSNAFRCPYHGWTFSNTGKLLGFPFNSGYGGREAKEHLPGLGTVPRVDSYRGFVFGSFAEHGPTLREHLGAAAEAFDRLSRLSPEGEVELTAGWLRHKVKANWKMLLENETDGYHPQFVHASIFSISGSGIGDLYGEKSTAISRDLGGGHTENDLRPEFRRIGQPLYWFGTTPEKLPGYVSSMERAYGDQAREILIDGSPHVMLFPNLFIAEIQLFVLQPTAVDETVQHVTAVQLKGAPDMSRRMLQQTIGSVGPAGFLLADDSEMYERNMRGVQVRDPEWLLLKRGTLRERIDERGHVIGDATDEVPQRAIWRRYRDVMEPDR
jgi:fatty-acyl-CoA synthase